MFQPPGYGSFPDLTWATTDLCDAHLADPAWGMQIVGQGLQSYGGRSWYFGEVATAGTAPGTAMSMIDIVSTPGQGRVLLADALADPAHAVVGDRMAALAAQNGWAGIVINGYVRDTRDLARMPIGIHALGARPNRSPNMQPATAGIRFELLGAFVEPGLWVYVDGDGVVLMKRRHTDVPQVA